MPTRKNFPSRKMLRRKTALASVESQLKKVKSGESKTKTFLKEKGTKKEGSYKKLLEQQLETLEQKIKIA